MRISPLTFLAAHRIARRTTCGLGMLVLLLSAELARAQADTTSAMKMTQQYSLPIEPTVTDLSYADKYHLDPNKFAVWGNSAGGYMAAMLGTTGNQPTIFDDPKLGNADVSSAVQALVVWYGAEDRLPDPKLSIVRYLSTAKSLPAFMIANGDADQTISPAQAQRLHDALIKAGAKSTLTILRGAGHEDPMFMATQMIPVFAFLDKTFSR
jgi:dienelactone hydrolase